MGKDLGEYMIPIPYGPTGGPSMEEIREIDPDAQFYDIWRDAFEYKINIMVPIL